MKSRAAFFAASAPVSVFVSVFALVGCFATNSTGPDAPGEATLGEPVAITRVEDALLPLVGDVSVDPGSGNVVVLTNEGVTDWYAGAPARTSRIAVVERGSGVVLGAIDTELWATDIGATGANKLLVSDGNYTHVELDLVSGELAPMAGLLEGFSHTPYSLDAQGGADPSGEDGIVVTFEEWPCPPSEVGFWSGKGTNRVLLRSVPLPSRLVYIPDVAFAPGRGLLYAITNQGLVAVDADTGDLVTVWTNTTALVGRGEEAPASWYFDGDDIEPAAIAWDSAGDRLIIAIGKPEVAGGLRLEEYEL